jgi:hypothetical protein
MAMVGYNNDLKSTEIKISGKDDCMIYMSSPDGQPIADYLFNGCLKYDELAPDEVIHSIAWKRSSPLIENTHKKKID